MVEEGKRVVVLAMVLTIAVAATPVMATYYSPVYSDTEPGHAAIMSDIYGGFFARVDELDFSNGDITAYRVYDYDDMAETIHIVNGDQYDIDQIWTDGIATVTAQAKHAGMPQSFGWNQGEDVEDDDGLATNYYPLLTDADILLGTIKEIEIAGPFLWGTQPKQDQWWSKNSLNSDGSDHMVTYKITGLETEQTVWLAFWEDLPSTGGEWDQDYQDFVVEIRAIPEPASMLLFGLGALVLLRKRRT